MDPRAFERPQSPREEQCRESEHTLPPCLTLRLTALLHWACVQCRRMSSMRSLLARAAASPTARLSSLPPLRRFTCRPSAPPSSLRSFLRSLPIPIIQSPMLGASSVSLTESVCAAGATGFLAGGAADAEGIAAEVSELRKRTKRPFGVNLLVTPSLKEQHALASPDQLRAALRVLAPHYSSCGATLPTMPSDAEAFAPDFDSQFAALVSCAPFMSSFAFGLLSRSQVDSLHAVGSFVLGTATTVAEAQAWVAVGADGIIAQGLEAGGHRGGFTVNEQQLLEGGVPARNGGLLPASTLVAALHASLPPSVALVAAGGIMDGRGVAAVLALGADAAQMGTAFLRTRQAATNAAWRCAIDAACAQQGVSDPTRLTRAFTGRFARGLNNRFMQSMRDSGAEAIMPPYPLTNKLTQPLRAAAVKQRNADLTSLWAGTGVQHVREGDAAELVHEWWQQAQQASQELAARTAQR